MDEGTFKAQGPSFWRLAQELPHRKISFGHDLVSGQDQKLIYHSYIPQLDPDYIVTLAKTALHHQVEALRDTIYKHVAAVTSIKVRLPVRIPTDYDAMLFRLRRSLTTCTDKRLSYF